MFKERYLSGTDRAVRGQFERIAATAARHLRSIGKEEEAREKFFQMLWDGWLSPSTPVLSNMGTNKGMPISCSGTYVGDEIDQFYGVRHETAMLTKNGFGTAAYLGDIRPRGSKISRGGKASGVLPVFKGFVQDSRDVSQGTRRGAWAGYLPIDHGDFDELADYVMAEVDDCNVGWNVSDAFIAKLDAGDPEAVRRYQKAMKMKMVTGRGYFFFPDKANKKRPKMYVERGLDVKAPQLCNEIMLHSSKEFTYTCVLSNMNLAHYDAWKDTDAVFWATVFLDCVISEFLEKAESEPMLGKAVRFTKAGRALGLGVCGFHSYLQEKRLAYESLDAHFKNMEIFKHLHDESKRASAWLAQQLGEPEWCVGHGVRNTHNIALPPTKSTALLMGGVSEGISPDPAMTYTQTSAAGEVDRIVVPLLKLMKERGVYTDAVINDLVDHQGSVQHVAWLTDDEKAVFKTAFEINQKTVLRMAAARAKHIDQWQSLNLFFAADEDPAWISECHKVAFHDPDILGLYYIYTQAGVQASKGECEACQ
jgi:ribonucleoside-diphosphate reductase alpha chain